MMPEEIGKETLPSILKDPFKKNHVKRIYVNFAEQWDEKTWKAFGVIEFKNSFTKGSQEFHSDSFDDIVRQMKNFIDSELK